ncbi:NADH-cytochrome B5 reductase [Mycena indigotica]|uniref:NADH-cytochrome B5 reductase n=1 Tax=Mycena indigotica TaxID=2126181 RepID=A0A8H6SKP4_9AGAR|nr:NADH-cytochrome B5 reductase [Mycena indigotica]KAF7301505.1 NADH-cytochrome B5 reductase [Mycena indigotica]
MPLPRRVLVASTLAGAFATATAAYLLIPDKSRSAPTVNDASLSPSHFTRSVLTSSKTSGPDTKLLVLTVPGFSKQQRPGHLAPIWSVFIKDDDIQVERPYTPLQGIDDDGRMLFWVKQYPKGEVGRWLNSKTVGEQVEFRGPLTTWAWKEDDWDHIVMISGGTGITPFFQLLHSAFTATSTNKRFTLLHSSRTPEELPPPEILEPLGKYAASHPDNFALHLFVDGGDRAAHTGLRLGRIGKKDIQNCLGISNWFWFRKPPLERTLFLDDSGSRWPSRKEFLPGRGPPDFVRESMNNSDGFGFDDAEIKLSDEEWDRLLSHKRRWCRLQPLVEARGYRIPKEMHPDRIDDWKVRPRSPPPDPLYPHLLEGLRVWDKRPVMLKLSRTDLWEAAISEHLASIPDPDNHTIPFYDLITFPEEPDSEFQWCIIVTPRLTDCRYSHLDTFKDLVDFITQVLEKGVCFMHRYNVAHTDVARTNIVWDDRPDIIPDDNRPGPKPSLVSRLFKDKPKTQRKYWFIDFGLACSYPTFEERGLVKGICGQHKNIPELSEEVAYDPFPLDIRQIGEMLTRDYVGLYRGLEFIEPWISRLRQDNPTDRPTATEALAEFQRVTRELSEEKLQSRLYKQGEWPNLARNTTIVLLVWFTLNGVFFWYNWDRLHAPLAVVSSLGDVNVSN